MAELSFPSPPLQDGNIVLRAWSQSDVPDIVRVCSDPLVSRFIGTRVPYTEDDARNWLETAERKRLAGTSLEMAIADAGTDAVLGGVAARVSTPTLSANIGYLLAAEARGQGFATAAVRLLCQWLFETFDTGRIELTTDPENGASQRVAARCGFQKEGLLRSHLRNQHTGERHDSLMWSLLPGELLDPPSE